VSRAIYQVDTTTAVGLVATAPKTVLAVLGTANFGVDLLGVTFSFDGVDPTQKPILWEICALSGATAGTSTSESSAIVQEGGRSILTGFTAASGYTVEPTTLVAVESQSISPNGGLYKYEWPFNSSPDSAVSQGFALRCTVPSGGSNVNVRAGFRFART
jgi:hypothetical protein